MQHPVKTNSYIIPFIVALALHVALLVVIMKQWSNETPQQVGLNSNVHVISAVVLSDAKESTRTPPKSAKPIEKKVEPKKPEPTPLVEKKIEPKPETKVETKTESKPEPKPEPKPEKSLPKTKNPLAELAKEKAVKEEQKLKTEKAQLQKKLLEQQLAAEQKKVKTEQQKEKAQAKALAQKLLQEQLASEERNLKLAAQEQQQSLQLQGVLDQYKSQIIAAISQYWVVPPETSPSIYCQLLIRVAPTGTVLSIELLRSSGDPVLDRSAQTAVRKASPLPVPKDPKAFDNFRELRLTFRPEGIS